MRAVHSDNKALNARLMGLLLNPLHNACMESKTRSIMLGICTALSYCLTMEKMIAERKKGLEECACACVLVC